MVPAKRAAVWCKADGRGGRKSPWSLLLKDDATLESMKNQTVSDFSSANGALDSCETRRRVERGGLSENVSFLESVRISKRGRVTGVIPSACDSRQ